MRIRTGWRTIFRRWRTTYIMGVSRKTEVNRGEFTTWRPLGKEKRTLPGVCPEDEADSTGANICHRLSGCWVRAGAEPARFDFTPKEESNLPLCQSFSVEDESWVAASGADNLLRCRFSGMPLCRRCAPVRDCFVVLGAIIALKFHLRDPIFSTSSLGVRSNGLSGDRAYVGRTLRLCGC